MISPDGAKSGLSRDSGKNITPFLFEDESLVRVSQVDGQPMFVAADVCRILGLAQPASAVRNLDEDEKGVHITHTPGGPQEVLVVTESGLYALIFRSRKPAAKRFRKWVTSEVLPSIRTTGGYGQAVVQQDYGYLRDLVEAQKKLLEAQEESRKEIFQSYRNLASRTLIIHTTLSDDEIAGIVGERLRFITYLRSEWDDQKPVPA